LTVALHDIGVGAGRLADVPNLRDAGCVIVAGLAGALDPSLIVGDVVIDTPGGRPIEGVAGRFGKIHSAGHLASTVEMKSRLWRETGALAVEMEQAAVAAALADSGVPLIGVRGVSDTADEALSPVLLDLIDDRGSPRPLALLASLARRPRLLRELSRLAKASAKAKRNMAAAVRKLLETQAIQRRTGASGSVK
jgi:hypothetical protein